MRPTQGKVMCELKMKTNPPKLKPRKYDSPSYDSEEVVMTKLLKLKWKITRVPDHANQNQIVERNT